MACDASQNGLIAVLSHKMEVGSGHPISFASRTLTKAERNYSNLEREALAVIFGVKKFHQYLYGRQFIPETDHKPLESLFNEKKATPAMAAARIQRWALTLAAYNYTIKYKPGIEHGNADALSRLPLPVRPRTTPVPAETVWTMELLDSTPVGVKEIQEGTRTDVVLSQEVKFVQHGWPSRNKDEALHPGAPLHPWEWPHKPWVRLHLDYAGPFLGKMFLIVVDVHSKSIEAFPMSTSTSEVTIEKLRIGFSTHGLPEMVVTDNGSNFVSKEFEAFLKQNGIRHVKTAPYHPSSNGLAETAVQTFKEGMKKLKDGSLETRVSRFLSRYRITPQTSTGVSRAKLLLGRKPRSRLDLAYPDISR